ncbi:hypothetical protein V8C86DRAFT_3083011 [Haematococcus lacustris]
MALGAREPGPNRRGNTFLFWRCGPFLKLQPKLASPPQEEKISDAERDVAEGEARQHEARIAYDTIVARMTEELNRFQKERAAEMSQLLREFALAQASAAAENARAWSAMLHDMQTIQTQTTQAGSVAF